MSFFLIRTALFVLGLFFVFVVHSLLVVVSLIVSIGVVDCLERLISKVTKVLSGILSLVHLLGRSVLRIFLCIGQ